MEKRQRWLQEQGWEYLTFLNEEFYSSCTDSVIAQCQRGSESEEEGSLGYYRVRWIHWYCQNWKLLASSCQVDWGVERKTSHRPPRCQAFRKPPLHMCQLRDGICPSLACDFASHWGLCSTPRVTQAYQGLQIHLHRNGDSCLSWHKGQAAWKSSILQREMSTASGYLTAWCIWFLVDLRSCLLWVCSGAALSFTPSIGAVFWCVSARQRKDHHPKVIWILKTF